MKRFISALCAVAVLALSLSVNVFADSVKDDTEKVDFSTDFYAEGDNNTAAEYEDIKPTSAADNADVSADNAVTSTTVQADSTNSTESTTGTSPTTTENITSTAENITENTEKTQTEPSTDSDFTYTVDENGAVITGYIGKSDEAEIPDKLGGQPVYAIAENALSNSVLQVLTVPNSITLFEQNAFGFVDSDDGQSVVNAKFFVKCSKTSKAAEYCTENGISANYFEIVYGDVTHDLKVTASDVLTVRRMIAGSVTADEDGQTAADVNLDGKVTANDVLIIRKKISGQTISLGDTEPLRYDYSIRVLNAKAVGDGDSITFSWSVVGKCTTVNIYDENGSLLKTAEKNDNTYTLSGLPSGNKASIKIIAVNDSVHGHFESEPIIIDGYVSLPAPETKVSGISSTQIKITWDRNNGYDYVELYYAPIDSDNYTYSTTLDAGLGEGIIGGLEPGKRYNAKLRGVIGENLYTEFSKQHFGTTRPADARNITVTAQNNNSISLNWDKSEGATEYRIYRSTSADSGYKKIATVYDTSFTDNKLNPGTKYYYQIESFFSIGDMNYYGQKVPIFAVTNPDTLSGLKISGKNSSEITIEWTKAKGAKKYRILRSTSAKSGYKSVGETDKNRFTNTGLNANTTYYYRVEPYTSFDGKKYNGGYAQISVKTDAYTVEVYGKSYQGRTLEAYIFNPNAKKTLFMDFAVHGFEDSYAHDGKVLVDCAKKIIDYYSSHLNELNGYRLVIVPCANPDGTYAGKNNDRANSNAFGRCTANHVDMNRDFYSGGFKAKESVALRDLIKKYKPTYYINCHGWDNETIGDSTIGAIFRKHLGLSGNKDGKYGADKGYIMGWVKNNIGSKSCLVEFKSPESVNYKKVVSAINELLKL